MPSRNLEAQNDTIEIDVPGDMIGLLAVGVGAGSHVDALVKVQVLGYEGNWYDQLVTQLDDDARITDIGTGVAAWEACGAWRKVRVIRTDANGDDCFTYLNVR